MRAVVPTVLVVDDDETVLKILARILAEEGYRVLTAGNGLEALNVAGTLEVPLPLVVTDLRMPVMDGRELAAHLARLTPAPQVLFVTGYAIQPEDQLPGPFLVKPFSPTEFATCVRLILESLENRPATGPSVA